MQHYDPKEDLRKKWLDELNAVTQTHRKSKHKQLQNLLKNNFEQFIKEKNDLLDPKKHRQGFWWTPPLENSIFSKILKILGIKPGQGSRLYRALRDADKKLNEKEFFKSLIVTNKTCQHTTEPNSSALPDLTDKTNFEKAMYDDPHSALQWLQNTIHALKVDDTPESRDVLERLSAFRYRLPEIEYLKLLMQVANKNPKSILIHLYQQLKDTPPLEDASSNAYYFMESHCFAAVLLQQTMFPKKSVQNELLDQRYKDAIKLFLILDGNVNAFMIDLENTPHTNIYNAMDHYVQRNAKVFRDNLIDEKHQGSFLTCCRFSENESSPANNKRKKKETDYSEKPLFIRRTHQLLIEQLLLDYTTDALQTLRQSRNTPNSSNITMPLRWLNFNSLTATSYGAGACTFYGINKIAVPPQSNTSSSGVNIPDCLKTSFSSYSATTDVPRNLEAISHTSHRITETYISIPSTLRTVEIDWISHLIAKINDTSPDDTEQKNLQALIRDKNPAMLKAHQIDWILLRIQEFYARNTTQNNVENMIRILREALTQTSANPLSQDSKSADDSESHPPSGATPL